MKRKAVKRDDSKQFPTDINFQNITVGTGSVTERKNRLDNYVKKLLMEEKTDSKNYHRILKQL